jgi:hypothetical protein
MFFRSSLAVGIVLLGEWSAAAPPRVVEVVPANEVEDEPIDKSDPVLEAAVSVLREGK